MEILQDIADEIKWAKQRAKRGWSDKDTWNTGEYLMKITAEMLRRLSDNRSHISWEDYFQANYQTRGYKSLDDVANDIDNYLEYVQTSWTDNLGFDLENGFVVVDGELSEFVNKNTPDEQRRISISIRKWREQEERLFSKAKNAMIFVAINSRALWD